MIVNYWYQTIFETLEKSDCSELLTILHHQHLSADDLWTLYLHWHLSADDLGNLPLKSSRNLLFEILVISTLRGISTQRYWVTACCDPGELKRSYSGLLFIGSQDDWLWSVFFSVWSQYFSDNSGTSQSSYKMVFRGPSNPNDSMILWTPLLLTSPTLLFLSLAPWDVHHFSLHQTSPLKPTPDCDSFFAAIFTCFP